MAHRPYLAQWVTALKQLEQDQSVCDAHFYCSRTRVGSGMQGQMNLTPLLYNVTEAPSSGGSPRLIINAQVWV